ncbi:serine hydrolase [Alteriqipengyuania sp.]|uniref:serine hydrolase n=1 Tax=Alteriqipengyuania sp. TaxID=2800692 RepID=UPI003512375A
MKIGKMRAMTMGMALALGTMGVLASPALAQTNAEATENRFDARAADVITLFNTDRDPAEVFADAFLSQVPPEQFAAVTAQLVAQLGDIVGVETVEQTGENGAKITLRFEKALASGPMTLEAAAPYKISGLLLNDIHPIDAGADTLSADIEALSGSKAAWFGPIDGDPIFTYGDATKPFALGSTFKLYVLAALSRAVSEGRLAWDQVVTLDQKSFPSGRLQTWPDGSPVTLHTAATLMISISDNTATDLVMKALGREAIEAEMRASGHTLAGKTLPFLTTREMFVIKSSDIGESYAAASEAERRAILASLDLEDITEDQFLETFTSGTPVLIEDIEWFASMTDQMGLMRLLAGLPDDTARQIMAVNTALGESDEEGWSYVGYKGGSEAGVLNMSWLLQDESGQWHMLAISQMDPDSEIDTAALLMMAKRILALAE